MCLYTLCTGDAGPVSPTKYWIRELTDEDRRGISSGKALTDVHINAAQKVLSQQFRSVAGLQSSCLSQGNHFVKVPSQSIQIHNTGCFHWVTTTSIQLPHSCHAKLSADTNRPNIWPKQTWKRLCRSQPSAAARRRG